MPRFTYRAKDSALRVVEGTIDADSEAAAISRLGGQGIYPISIAESGRASGFGPAGLPRRVSPQALASTTRQLADLIAGGLPLLSALTLLAKQTEHRSLARVVESMAEAVRDGRSLSETLAMHPAVFPPLYVNMVRAGEVGGALDQSLARLADLGEHEAELRGRVLTASAYPIFLLGFSTIIVGILITFVIPTLAQVFIESGQVLPLPTRILLAISDGFARWWGAIVAGVVVGGWLLRRWHRQAGGKAVVDRFVLGLPGVGALTRKLETARFTRNLGVLVGQGVPVLQALEVARSNLSNALLQQALVHVQEAVRDGSSIAGALEASKQFPVFVSNMVAVGEESGSVDAALVRVASTYEREVDRLIRTLTTLLEPVLLVVVGGVVMFIILAMLLPVFQIGLVVQ